MALILSSVFFNLRLCDLQLLRLSLTSHIEPNTNSFYERGALLFFAILLNAFGSALEVRSLSVIDVQADCRNRF